MIDEHVMFATVAATFALATVVFFVWSLRHPARRRPYGFAIAIACLSMAVANVLMAAEILSPAVASDVAYPNGRFVGYFTAFGVIGVLLGAAAGAGRVLTALLVVVVYGLPASVLGGWYLSGSAATAATALAFASVLLVAFLLVGPLSRAANRVSSDRRLLYWKVRNLSLLIWIVLPVVGLLSDRHLGVLDSFTWIVLGSYVDLVLFVGTGAILLRRPAAIDDMAGGDAGTVAGTTDDAVSEQAVESLP